MQQVDRAEKKQTTKNKCKGKGDSVSIEHIVLKNCIGTLTNAIRQSLSYLSSLDRGLLIRTLAPLPIRGNDVWFRVAAFDLSFLQHRCLWGYDNMLNL